MKKISRDDLEELIILRLARYEKCAGVRSVGIYRLAQFGRPKWETSVIDYGGADAKRCRDALQHVIEPLQKEYQLEISYL